MYKTLLVSDIGNDTNAYSMYPHCHYITMGSLHVHNYGVNTLHDDEKIENTKEVENIRWKAKYLSRVVYPISCGNQQVFVIQYFTIRINIVWVPCRYNTIPDRQECWLYWLQWAHYELIRWYHRDRLLWATVSSLQVRKTTSLRSFAMCSAPFQITGELPTSVVVQSPTRTSHCV